MLTSRSCFEFNDFDIVNIHKKWRRPLLYQLFIKTVLISTLTEPNQMKLGFVITNDNASYVAKEDSICLFSIGEEAALIKQWIKPCVPLSFWFSHNLSLKLHHNLSFWVLSHCNLLSFYHNLSFVIIWVLRQFEVLSFIIIWVFELHHNFTFLSFFTIFFMLIYSRLQCTEWFFENVGDNYQWRLLLCVAQGIQIQYISDNHTKGSSPDKDFCHYIPTSTKYSHSDSLTIQ